MPALSEHSEHPYQNLKKNNKAGAAIPPARISYKGDETLLGADLAPILQVVEKFDFSVQSEVMSEDISCEYLKNWSSYPVPAHGNRRSPDKRL